MSETTENQVNETPEPTEVEQKALEQGWLPKEEWEQIPENAGKKWRDAEEFVDRGELFSKIDDVTRKLKSTQKTLDQLNQHHKQVKETEYQRALNTLKAQKKAALEDGDADQLIAIDDKIATVREQQRVATVTETPDEPYEFKEWRTKNKWYDQDEDMAEDANALGLAHKAKNPDKSPGEVLVFVEQRIRKLYPEKFTNPNKPKTSGVDSPSSSRPSNNNSSYQLTEDEERVARNFERQRVMTREAYIKELKGLK